MTYLHVKTAMASTTEIVTNKFIPDFFFLAFAATLKQLLILSDQFKHRKWSHVGIPSYKFLRFFILISGVISIHNFKIIIRVTYFWGSTTVKIVFAVLLCTKILPHGH